MKNRNVSNHQTVEEVCDRYIEAIRNGETLSMDDFADQYPDLKREILATLPTVMLLEQARRQRINKRSDGRVNVGPEKLTQLGDYEILNELGRGGMGVVYEARQTSLDRKVALKVLPSHLATPARIKKFLGEAAIAAKLHHSNIVPVYSAGQDGDVCFYAMERLDGIGLDECLTTSTSSPASTKLSTNQIVEIGIQAASALQYAHDNSVLHRDIKPANLILSENNRVWLTDFGLASFTTAENPTSKSFSGTLRYCSPERLSQQPESYLSDIYSLGVTLLELLLGQPIELDAKIPDRRERVLSAHTSALQLATARIPVDLKCVLEKAIAADPAARYQSAVELQHDLERFQQRRPVHANRLSVFGQLKRWTHRRPALAASVTLAGLLLAGIATVSTLSYFQVEQLLRQEKRQKENAALASQVATEAIDEIFNQVKTDGPLFGDGSFSTPSASQPNGRRSTVLLNQLTRFYERLAIVNDGVHHQPEAIMARHKVGQLQLKLGDYQNAINSLEVVLVRHRWLQRNSPEASTSDDVVLEAQVLNEIGLARRLLAAESDRRSVGAENNQAKQLLETWLDKNPTDAAAILEYARSRYLGFFQPRPGMGPSLYPPDFESPAARKDSAGPKKPGARKRRQRRYRIESRLSPKARNTFEEIIAQMTADGTDLARLVCDDSGQVKPASSITQSLPTTQDEATKLADPLVLLAELYREFGEERWIAPPNNEIDFNWESHRKSIAIFEWLTKTFPDHPGYLSELIRTKASINVFDAKISQEAIAKAEQDLSEALPMIETLWSKHPDVAAYWHQFIHVNYKLSFVCRRIEESAESISPDRQNKIEKSLRAAFEKQKELLLISEDSDAYRLWAAKFAIELADCHNLSGVDQQRIALASEAQKLLAPVSQTAKRRQDYQFFNKRASQILESK